ncbi:metallophosphoesterase [Massilia forsythiae]|uniref:Metallophosphoesterase n=1 Tax=Massilia forsythiae TaxID=2728020 RepID=A0A7Z2VXH7_9BURK|nr:metallophosphoesterase [Massilia forsythiae]QJE01276.1 metallophosphoesterase [Massilia forsythiae]
MKIRALHLSDLHLSTKKNDHDQHTVIAALCKDIENLRESEDFDFIFFTGDLVGKGSYSEDYRIKVKEDFIDKILSAANLTQDQFFLCPGNHDLELLARDKIYESGLQNALSDRINVNEFISEHESHTSAFRSLEKFNSLSADFGSTSCLKRTPLYANFLLHLHGQKIGVAALNSAWRATGRSNDQDCGTLILGERQIELSAKGLENCDVKIALVHHPLNWLSPKDFASTQRAIARNFDILLHGHVHEGDGLSLVAPHNNLIICGAGCLYQSRDYFNGFSIIEINTKENTFHQETREYFHGRDCFDVSVRFAGGGIFNSPLKKNSEVNFVLPERSVQRICDEANRQLVSSAISDVAPEDIGDLFVEPRISRVSPNQIDVDIASQGKTNLISIPDLEKDPKNFFIWGGKESGKTTTLNYLAVRATRATALSGNVAFCIDGRNFSSASSILSAFGTFCDGALKRSEIERALETGKATIHIDNCPLDRNSLQYQNLVKFTKLYSKNKFIFSAEDSARITLVEQALPDLGVNVSELFLLPFSRRQVRALIKNWFGDAADESSHILDGVLRVTAKLQLPRSPFLMSMILWLNERKIAFSPVNYATLIENFIEGLLEKLADTNFRSEIYTFRIKQHFLCELAAKMSRDPVHSISRLDLESFAVEYFKARPQPKAKPLELINHFFSRGVLLEIGEDVRFKLECFREYFVARRMLDKPDYLDECTSKDNLLKYINEIDYYSGLKQDNIELLSLVAHRLEYASRAVDLNITSNDYSRVASHDDSILDSLRDRVHDLILSRPNNQEQEAILDDFDEINLHTQKNDKSENKEEKINHSSIEADQIEVVQYDSKYSDYLKHLILASMVLRNSELVDDNTSVEQIFHTCIEHWSRNIIFALVQLEILSQDRGSFTDEHRNERSLKKMVSTVIPAIFLAMVIEYLGTAKLADVMNRFLETHANQELPGLITVLLYAELGLPKYMDKIEDFMERPNVLGGSRDLIFTNLLTNYMFKKLSSNDQTRIEAFLAKQAKTYRSSTSTGGAEKAAFIQQLRDRARTIKISSPDSIKDK